MDFLFWKAFCQFHARDALAASQLAEMWTFAIALAGEPNANHAAALRAIECSRVLAIRSRPHPVHRTTHTTCNILVGSNLQA